jgi:hypothetical protein
MTHALLTLGIFIVALMAWASVFGLLLAFSRYLMRRRP